MTDEHQLPEWDEKGIWRWHIPVDEAARRERLPYLSARIGFLEQLVQDERVVAFLGSWTVELERRSGGFLCGSSWRDVHHDLAYGELGHELERLAAQALQLWGIHNMSWLAEAIVEHAANEMFRDCTGVERRRYGDLLEDERHGYHPRPELVLKRKRAESWTDYLQRADREWFAFRAGLEYSAGLDDPSRAPDEAPATAERADAVERWRRAGRVYCLASVAQMTVVDIADREFGDQYANLDQAERRELVSNRRSEIHRLIPEGERLLAMGEIA